MYSFQFCKLGCFTDNTLVVSAFAGVFEGWHSGREIMPGSECSNRIYVCFWSVVWDYFLHLFFRELRTNYLKFVLLCRILLKPLLVVFFFRLVFLVCYDDDLGSGCEEHEHIYAPWGVKIDCRVVGSYLLTLVLVIVFREMAWSFECGGS